MKINYEDMLSNMYESPIRTFQKQLEMRYENGIMNAVAEYGIHVDKDELVKALNYDRNQYDKGYSDAINKHKWHDLREAPEDLPEVGKPFVYALHVKDIMANLIADKVLYYIAMGLEEEVKRMEHQGNEYAEYLAWMYFDPFEEVSE